MVGYAELAVHLTRTLLFTAHAGLLTSNKPGFFVLHVKKIKIIQMYQKGQIAAVQ